MNFTCTICEETSTRICARCTKDTCANHLCDKCGACSDCCSCELKLRSDEDEILVSQRFSSGPHEPTPEPHPMPDPDPAPEPEPIPEYPR